VLPAFEPCRKGSALIAVLFVTILAAGTVYVLQVLTVSGIRQQVSRYKVSKALSTAMSGLNAAEAQIWSWPGISSGKTKKIADYYPEDGNFNGSKTINGKIYKVLKWKEDDSSLAISKPDSVNYVVIRQITGSGDADDYYWYNIVCEAEAGGITRMVKRSLKIKVPLVEINPTGGDNFALFTYGHLGLAPVPTTVNGPIQVVGDLGVSKNREASFNGTVACENLRIGSHTAMPNSGPAIEGFNSPFDGNISTGHRFKGNVYVYDQLCIREGVRPRFEKPVVVGSRTIGNGISISGAADLNGGSSAVFESTCHSNAGISAAGGFDFATSTFYPPAQVIFEKKVDAVGLITPHAVADGKPDHLFGTDHHSHTSAVQYVDDATPYDYRENAQVVPADDIYGMSDTFEFPINPAANLFDTMELDVFESYACIYTEITRDTSYLTTDSWLQWDVTGGSSSFVYAHNVVKVETEITTTKWEHKENFDDLPPYTYYLADKKILKSSTGSSKTYKLEMNDGTLVADNLIIRKTIIGENWGHLVDVGTETTTIVKWHVDAGNPGPDAGDYDIDADNVTGYVELKASYASTTDTYGIYQLPISDFQHEDGDPGAMIIYVELLTDSTADGVVVYGRLNGRATVVSNASLSLLQVPDDLIYVDDNNHTHEANVGSRAAHGELAGAYTGISSLELIGSIIKFTKPGTDGYHEVNGAFLCQETGQIDGKQGHFRMLGSLMYNKANPNQWGNSNMTHITYTVDPNLEKNPPPHYWGVDRIPGGGGGGDGDPEVDEGGTAIYHAGFQILK
jgi:hypothetical protein